MGILTDSFRPLLNFYHLPLKHLLARLHAPPTGSCSVNVTIFIFNGTIGDQLPQKVLDRSSPRFQHVHIWVGMISPSFIFAIVQRTLLW